MAESFDHFPEISSALYKTLSQAVRKVAFDLQANAIEFAPVDTGFLRNSIYVSTYGKSSYGAHGQTQAKLTNYQFAYVQLPEVEMPDNDLTAIVAVAANYGIYVEFGTRFMRPQPFFFPAVRVAQVELDGALRVIEAKLGEAH